MEAAALALAEVAAREAAARDRGQNAVVNGNRSGGGGDFMDFDNHRRPLQVENQIGASEAELLQHLMSLPDEARDQFLQVLSQQQTSQLQQHINFGRMRPQKHYLTISTEGKDLKKL